MGRAADLDFAGHAVRLHASGRVDGVPPQVVRELVVSNHARDDRAARDSYPELHAMIREPHGLDRLPHVEREIGDRLSMIAARLGQSSCRDIGVADCLDLLHAERARATRRSR